MARIWQFLPIVSTFFFAILGQPLASQTSTVDVRVILIDEARFMSIGNKSERHAAVENMIRDIAMIEREIKTGESYVLVRGFPNFKFLKGIDPRNALSGQRAFLDFSARLKAGGGNRPGGFSFIAMRNSLRSLFETVSQRHGARGHATIDLHVFAENWWAERNNAKYDLFGQWKVPTVCLLERHASPLGWPANTTLTVEFRPPVGSPEPSKWAMDAFIFGLTGSPDNVDNVLTRGAKGARCEMTRGEPVKPFMTSGKEDSADQCEPATFVSSDATGIISACGSKAPPADAIAANLDRGPITLATKDDAKPVVFLSLLSSTSPTNVDVDGVIGGVSAMLNVSAAKLGLGAGNQPAQLTLNPRPGCRSSNGFALRFGETASRGPAISVVASRHYCTKATINLGRVATQ